MNKAQALAKYKDIEAELLKLKYIIESPEDLFSEIRNYSDVCKKLGENEVYCPYQQIKQIEKLFNGDWKKNWDNKNQSKYYPYFEQKSSGLVFYYSYSCYDDFSGQVAVYKDSKTSDFVGKTFIDIYKRLM